MSGNIDGNLQDPSPGATCPSLSTAEDSKDYRSLYQQEFDRRTTLMKLAQKATRDYDELTHRYQNANLVIEELRTQLEKRDVELLNLQNASEAVYHEYQSLKARYEVESETMSQAFSRASEWYKENQCLRQETVVLKRQSALLLQRVSESNSPSLHELAQICDKDDQVYKEQAAQNDKEVNKLMSQIKKLERELAVANTELNRTRQDEFDAQEQLMDISKQNDQQSLENDQLKLRLQELEYTERRLTQVSTLVIAEVEKLQSHVNIESVKAQEALSEAAKAKREHASLARQSTLVLSEAASDDRVRKALEDVHELTTKLLQERENHNKTVTTLKNQLASLQNLEQEQEFELMKHKITFLEEENALARRKMFEARRESENLIIEVRDLRLQLKEIQFSGGLSSPSIPSPPPPPTPPLQPIPAPPPPPPPPPVSAVVNLASVLGPSTRKKSPEADNKEIEDENGKSGGGMDDLIDQIKKGGIQLKQTSLGNNFLRKYQHSKKPTEPLPNSKSFGKSCAKPTDPVHEMKNILANMKRTKSGRVRPSAISKEKQETNTSSSGSLSPEIKSGKVTEENIKSEKNINDGNEAKDLRENSPVTSESNISPTTLIGKLDCPSAITKNSGNEDLKKSSPESSFREIKPETQNPHISETKRSDDSISKDIKPETSSSQPKNESTTTTPENDSKTFASEEVTELINTTLSPTVTTKVIPIELESEAIPVNSMRESSSCNILNENTTSQAKLNAESSTDQSAEQETSVKEKQTVVSSAVIYLKPPKTDN